MSAVEQETKSLFRYRFGGALFDEARFELTVAGLSVDVQRKPLEVLALLLAHRGEVVTKEELLEAVWEGRTTVENVIPIAIGKLRDALGDDNAGFLVTQPRVGYRLNGVVERIAIGRTMTSRIELRQGDLVPARPNFKLETLLSASKNSEVWMARHLKTKERRVYKFTPDGERLSTLKREVTLFRLLHDSLGERDDLVRILDWNFETAPFFLECEYGGENLTQWAQSSPGLISLSLQQRIALFLKIADVVAAAHDCGVLHKDIKPTNVLIIPNSNADEWQIRLTDFGSGRLLDPERIRDLGITQLGLTMTATLTSSETGTLLYLAPELIAQQVPTIKSDIYALGMMLYQLIVGDLRKPMVSGWERDIEDELLRDDIRAATDGDPDHRLNSVYELIHRLRTLDARHLQLQQQRQAQVMADQARETLHRVRARRPWMIVAGVLLIIGLTGFATTSWLYVRASREQVQTEQQAARADAVTEFLDNDVLGSVNFFSRETAQQHTIKEAMDNAVKNIDGKFISDPMTEASIRITLGRTFLAILDADAAEVQYQRAIMLFAQEGDAARPRWVQSRYQLADVFSVQSKPNKALAELTDADRARVKYRIDGPQTRLIFHQCWSNYFYNLQQNSQAIPHLEQALQLLLKQPTPRLLEVESERTMLAEAYFAVNRINEAEQVDDQILKELKQPGNSNQMLCKHPQISVWHSAA